MEREIVQELARFCCEEIDVDDPAQLDDLERFANLVEEQLRKMRPQQPGPGAIGPFSTSSPNPSGRSI